MKPPKLEIETLARLLFGDGQSGLLFWRPRTIEFFKNKKSMGTWNTRFAGKKVSIATNRNGYSCIKVFCVEYKVHRLIWALQYGEWPDEIDHLNGVRKDNRICNLRNVDHLENSKNMQMRHSNTSGVNGVTWQRQHRKWHAYATCEGKRYHLGYFESKDEAIAARLKANILLEFHENHGRAAA